MINDGETVAKQWRNDEFNPELAGNLLISNVFETS